MKYKNQLFNKKAGLLGAICGGLLMGIAAIPSTSVAEPASSVNPNPSILNEPQFQNRQPNPQISPAQTPATQSPPATPLPEEQNSPTARVMPVNGQVKITLTNATGDPITYQVIGDTKQRTLASNSEITLLDLEAPVTLTFQRPNGGLIQVMPQASSEPGVVEVTLDETTQLGTDTNALIVEETGLIFVN